jgi:hypothetical protein
MKSGYPHPLGPGQPPHLCGAVNPPMPTLGDLGTQADDLSTRIQHLQTGIRNLRQLQDLTTTTEGDHPPHVTVDLATAEAELSALQQAVDDFELSLASRRLSWQQLGEPFWQAVRYGGLGLVGGWVLHWLVRG